MLVILSFGLVLLATILLVVGLLNDDGINLIYLSIAASAAAAIVLYLAFRRARPEQTMSAAGPAPLDRELDAIVHDTDDTDDTDEATTVTPAAAPPPPPPVVEPAPPTTPVPAVAADDIDDAVDEAEPGTDPWADDADWEVDDLEFPIADYDDLSVAEIMPLLPQLYSDELDIVYEREQTTKNRATILARLDKLKETGTEADAEEAGIEPPAVEPVADGEPEPEVEPEPVPEPDEPDEVAPVAAAPASPPRSVSLLDDEDDDDAFFPIADYDDLSVSQIIPLLSQLEQDELDDVKARELSGANRPTLVAEIDRHLGVGVSTPGWSAVADEPVGLDELEVVEEPAPSVATTPAEVGDRDRLPIYGYDTMTVAEIRPRLGELSADELEQVLAYEEARDNRRTIVNEIQRRLVAGGPVVTSSSAPEPEPRPVERTPRKATKAARKTTGRVAPAKKAATKRAQKATKAPAKRTAKKAAKRNSTRFPIAGYDELTVAQIRPRLAKLSRPQLELVRERELTGAGRRTILNDIDNRLS